MTTLADILAEEVKLKECSLCGLPIGDRPSHPDQLLAFLGGTYHHADAPAPGQVTCCRRQGALCESLIELDRRRAAVATAFCPRCGSVPGTVCREDGADSSTHPERLAPKESC